MIRDPPYRHHDDVVYIDSEPPRRTTYLRRPPANEYVYVDSPPPTVISRHPYRSSDVVYVDNSRPIEYEEDVVYLDNHNNEVEYIYDDQPDYHRRNYPRSRRYHPSLTNIVYQ